MPGCADTILASMGCDAAPNPRSSSRLQFCPYRCGVLTRAVRLLPKTSAAVTAVTATVMAASALRTGTAVRPYPRSNAIRSPILAVTEPDRPSAVPSLEDLGRTAGCAEPGDPSGTAA